MNISAIQESLANQGYALIPQCVDSEESAQFFQDVYHYLQQIPRRQGCEIPDSVIGSPESLQRPLSKSQVKECRSRWLLHHGFGAPTEANAFHLPIMWHLRQRPDLFHLYQQLYHTDDLVTNIDRFCCKLPGSGETEFIHIDSDPHYYQKNAPLQSMIFFSDTTFYAIPGSHTEEFHQSICDNYSYLEKKKRPRSMTMIDKKRDVLKLEKKIEPIHVPANSLLIWSENLWHASRPNKSDKIRFAIYYGFSLRNNCALTSQERLESYQTGRRPIRYPSGQPTHLVPNRYKSYPYSTPEKPSLMQRYLNLLPETYHGTHLVKKTGIVVPWLDEEAYDPRQTHQYHPYPLTELGRRLLE